MSLYDATIPVYLRMLANLRLMLEKSERHAAETGVGLQSLLDARLAPDMKPLVGQVQMASDSAKGGAARLAGVAAPSFPDTETTMDELKARIDKTIAFVETVTRDQVDGDEERIVELVTPSATFPFSAREFVHGFSIPNFLFHVTTAYGLMRGYGAPLGKMDYLAGSMTARA